MEDTNCLVIAPKPDEYCVSAIGWRHYDGTLAPITDVYTGPEEHSSVGPFFGCDYRYELYRDGSDLTLLLWTYKVRSGLPNTEENRDYDWLRIFRGSNLGREWSMEHQVALGSRAEK